MYGEESNNKNPDETQAGLLMEDFKKWHENMSKDTVEKSAYWQCHKWQIKQWRWNSED